MLKNFQLVPKSHRIVPIAKTPHTSDKFASRFCPVKYIFRNRPLFPAKGNRTCMSTSAAYLNGPAAAGARSRSGRIALSCYRCCAPCLTAMCLAPIYPSSSPLIFCDFLPAFCIYSPLFFHHPVIGAPPTWLHPMFVRAAAAWTLSPIFNFNSNTGNREKKTLLRLLLETRPRSSQALPTAKDPFSGLILFSLASFSVNITCFHQL